MSLTKVSYSMIKGNVLSPLDFGAVGDGVADDTQALIAALTAIQTGQVLDLAGCKYAVYTGVTATTAPTNAVTLANTVRLYNKTNVTIRNGTIFAANPGTSGSVKNFPTTFNIDGCTDITVENVNFFAKGEAYGDSDASVGLTYAQRRDYVQQNGGSAFIVVRSENVTINNCNFYLAGSVGSAYVSSAHNIVFNDCYSSPMSLGYAAYAVDAWCGNTATSGYPFHTSVFNNCRTNNNGATYGSKGGVVAEDGESRVYVNGGVYEDCYANPTLKFGGNAFVAGSCLVEVTGAIVNNCASVAMGVSSSASPVLLNLTGVIARNIRLSGLILPSSSFGNVTAIFSGCDINIVGGSEWVSDPYLSVSSVITSARTSTNDYVIFNNNTVIGADTFCINVNACYGGVKVVGGYYEVLHHIFDSVGWGGGSANSFAGYELLGGVQFKLSAASATPTITDSSVNAISAIKNQDGAGVFTYQYINFDPSVVIQSSFYNNFIVISTLGSGLDELKLLGQSLQNCYQIYFANVGYTATAEAISLDGVAGSNSKVTFAFTSNKLPGLAYVIDDTNTPRRLLSTYSGPDVTGGTLKYGYFINGTTYNITAGSTYAVISSS
jgi:hypothetical protein